MTSWITQVQTAQEVTHLQKILALDQFQDVIVNQLDVVGALQSHSEVSRRHPVHVTWRHVDTGTQDGADDLFRFFPGDCLEQNCLALGVSGGKIRTLQNSDDRFVFPWSKRTVENLHNKSWWWFLMLDDNDDLGLRQVNHEGYNRTVTWNLYRAFGDSKRFSII